MLTHLCDQEAANRKRFLCWSRVCIITSNKAGMIYRLVQGLLMTNYARLFVAV